MGIIRVGRPGVWMPGAIQVGGGAGVQMGGGGGGGAPWWQLPGRTCLAAYSPADAASYAASLTNLAGGTAMIEQSAPEWVEGSGWRWSATTQWLDTNIAPAEGMTMVVQVASIPPATFVCGAWNAGASKGFGVTRTTHGYRAYWNGGSYISSDQMADDTLGIAGNTPYANGVAYPSMAAWGATISNTIAIGRMNGFATGRLTDGYIRRFALYAEALTADEMLILHNRRVTTDIAQLLVFGDSITAGLGASGASARWANIVAADLGIGLVNAGISSTVLQNTTQNTVTTIGGAAANNGRDTVASRVTAYTNAASRVVILYGLNDLRLNDPAFTAANFQTDLGEIVDLIVADGVSADNIVIGSPPYIPNASYSEYSPYNGGNAIKHAAYVAAATAVASAKGTRYADVYQAMADNGGDSLISGDGIHPNDSGHLVIANAFLAVI